MEIVNNCSRKADAKRNEKENSYSIRKKKNRIVHNYTMGKELPLFNYDLTLRNHVRYSSQLSFFVNPGLSVKKMQKPEHDQKFYINNFYWAKLE